MEFALKSWNNEELNHLAEFLVFYFCQPDQAFSEYLLISRLKDIFEIEIKIKESSTELFSLSDNSFVMKLFHKIIETAECKNYARFVMKDIYDTINLEFLESIGFKNNDVNHYLQKRCNLKRRDHSFTPGTDDKLTSDLNTDEVEESILSFAEDLEQMRSVSFQRFKSENIEESLDDSIRNTKTRK